MADIELVEPQHVRANPRAAGRARGNRGDPGIPIERREIHVVERNRLDRAEPARRIRAAAAVGGAVHFHDAGRARALVEGIDVLRHQQEVAPASRVPSLERGERLMGLIRTRGEDAQEALAYQRHAPTGSEVKKRSVASSVMSRAQIAPGSLPRKVGMPLARLIPAPVSTTINP